MIFTQLKAFHAVATHGSFSKAAATLGVTQPALTIQVKALEDGYGVKLLQRNGRLVNLTESGSRLFALSQRLATIEEHARDVLSMSNELEQGNLRIAADGPHIVMGLVARFIATHPKVRLSVAMGNTAFVRRQLFDGNVDVAILPGVGGHRRVHAIHLWPHTLVVVVANNHPWARRKTIAFKELENQPLLAREEGSTTHRLFRNALHAAKLQPNFILEFGSREAICEAAAAGIGVGLVWELESRGSTKFTTLRIRDVDICSSDFVACLKSERSRLVVKSFFSVAAAFVSSGP